MTTKQHGLTGRPSNFKGQKKEDALDASFSGRCLGTEKEIWKEAAKAKGLTLNNFMREAANAYAAQILKDN